MAKQSYFKTRIAVLEKQNYKCQKCGEDANIVHHINKNRKDNKMGNLMVLCATCHGALHFNSGKHFIWRTSQHIYRDLKKIADSKCLSVNQQLSVIVMSAIIVYKRINQKKGDR